MVVERDPIKAYGTFLNRFFIWFAPENRGAIYPRNLVIGTVSTAASVDGKRLVIGRSSGRA